MRSIGYPEGPVISIAMQVMEKNYKFSEKEDVMNLLQKILANPVEYENDAVLGLIALQLIPEPETETEKIDLKTEAVSTNIFGAEQIEEGALVQIKTATRLPVSVAGALMPDAHAGYGLPIGGVLAT